MLTSPDNVTFWLAVFPLFVILSVSRIVQKLWTNFLDVLDLGTMIGSILGVPPDLGIWFHFLYRCGIDYCGKSRHYKACIAVEKPHHGITAEIYKHVQPWWRFGLYECFLVSLYFGRKLLSVLLLPALNSFRPCLHLTFYVLGRNIYGTMESTNFDGPVIYVICLTLSCFVA